MGGFIHIDHLLLTPRGVLVLDTRRVAGLIFGGDQMSDWTVIGGGRRYTFDNPQPALYDRIAAVKALVGEVPVEGRLLFSNVGKFTKGIPKWVLMLDGIEVEFRWWMAACGTTRHSPSSRRHGAGWSASFARARTCSPTFKTGGKIARHWPCSLRPAPPAIRREVAPPRRRYGADSRVHCAGTSERGKIPRQQIGASVSSMRRSAGMWGTASRRLWPRRSSFTSGDTDVQTQLQVVIEFQASAVKQCATPPTNASRNSPTMATKSSCASR